jgi:UPF0716 protein FxsA
MGLIILFAFIATPIVEIALFIEAGDRFGLWPTLGAVILTAIVGTQLLRSQGLATWARATRSLQKNEFPIAEVYTGLCLVLAGALLLTPGFLTDAVGLALFAPPVRALLARLVKSNIKRGKGPRVWVNGAPMDFSERGDGVIDGEFEEMDQRPPKLREPDAAAPARHSADSPWRKGSPDP